MNLLSTDNQRMYFTKRRMHNKQVLRVTQSTRDHGAKLIAEMCPHFISVSFYGDCGSILPFRTYYLIFRAIIQFLTVI